MKSLLQLDVFWNKGAKMSSLCGYVMQLGTIGLTFLQCIVYLQCDRCYMFSDIII